MKYTKAAIEASEQIIYLLGVGHVNDIAHIIQKALDESGMPRPDELAKLKLDSENLEKQLDRSRYRAEKKEKT